jgi:hypothetical protein
MSTDSLPFLIMFNLSVTITQIDIVTDYTLDGHGSVPGTASGLVF